MDLYFFLVIYSIILLSSVFYPFPLSASSLISVMPTQIVLVSSNQCCFCNEYAATWKKMVSQLKKKHITASECQYNSASKSFCPALPAALKSTAIMAYPSIFAITDNRYVQEFLKDRNDFTQILKFAQQARKKAPQTYRLKQQRGGSLPVDLPTAVPPTQQWSGPQEAAPPPAYNAGLYTGAPFAGPWGNVPVTPTTSHHINKNLASAEPPPGATFQYPGTNHSGNNFSTMPGVNWFQNGTNGPYRIQCAPRTVQQTAPEPVPYRAPDKTCGGARRRKSMRKRGLRAARGTRAVRSARKLFRSSRVSRRQRH